MAQALIHPAGPIPHCVPDHAPKDSPITPQGLRAWLPALVVLVGMPLLALLTTKYVMIPPLQELAHSPPIFASGNGQSAIAVVSLKKTAAYTAKDLAPSHALNSNILLILGSNSFKDQVVKNQDKLAAIAAAALKSKGAIGLPDSAAKSAFRAELMSQLNYALGGPVIRELYVAGWPAQ